MRVIVIGAGYVGLVAGCCLANSGHRVTGVESDPAKLARLVSGSAPIKEKDIDRLLSDGLASGQLIFSDTLPQPLATDVVMVAVGTPSLTDGATDLSYIQQALAEVSAVVSEPLVLIMKSSVPPGTGRRLAQRYFADKPVTYVANPEFLREGQAVNDWYQTNRIVIGTEDSTPVAAIRELYADIAAPVITTDITSAETIKYAANAFLATKISFVNEIANLCEAVGADIDYVVEGLGLDPRIGKDFLRAGLGYGGSCFPKDTRALNLSALNNGYDFRLLKSTIEVNTKQPIVAVHKLDDMLGGLEGKEIAILGLAFKPETDDVRESPALAIARLLYERDARLRACDPVAIDNARPLLPAGVRLSTDIYEATQGASAVVLVTEWPEFINADWARLREGMADPYIILDGRNALAPERLSGLGFHYSGIGRRPA